MTAFLLRLFLALALAAGLAAPASARNWVRAETSGFVIYSDGFPLETARWADKLERLDRAMFRQFGVVEKASGRKLTVYLLADPTAVERVGGQDNLTGYYRATAEGSYALAHRRLTYRDDELSGQMTLFHEYAHHFMARTASAAYPVWYREGFAEYVSTMEFTPEGRWVLGRPVAPRMKAIARKSLSIEDILGGTPKDFSPRDRVAFYGWSWLLVHMLNADPAGKGRLNTYLAHINAGDGPEAAAGAFAPLDEMEARLRRYAAAAVPYTASTGTLGPIPEPRVTELDAVASRLAQVRMARVLGYGPVSATSARKLAAAAPGRVDVLVELARTERDVARQTGSTDFGAAERAADAALALAPGDAEANAIKADIAMRRLRSTRSTPAEWASVRHRLTRAIEAGPDDAFARLLLFRSYLLSGNVLPPDGQKAIRQAFEIAPESGEIRIAFAIYQAMAGRFDAARRTIAVLAADPDGPEVGRRALARINAMEARAAFPEAAREAVSADD